MLLFALRQILEISQDDRNPGATGGNYKRVSQQLGLFTPGLPTQ